MWSSSSLHVCPWRRHISICAAQLDRHIVGSSWWIRCQSRLMTKLVTSWVLSRRNTWTSEKYTRTCALFVTFVRFYFVAYCWLRISNSNSLSERSLHYLLTRPDNLRSQTHPVLQSEMTDGPNRSGVIAKELCKPLILPAVSLDDAVIDPWMQTTLHGRVDFAEVCCISDSLLSGSLTSIDGRAVQHSHWNGFDLVKKSDTEKLKEDLLEKRQRVVWMFLCITQRTQQSQARSKCHRLEFNILIVFLWLVEQDWGETILEQIWESTSLVRDGAFSDF